MGGFSPNIDRLASQSIKTRKSLQKKKTGDVYVNSKNVQKALVKSPYKTQYIVGVKPNAAMAAQRAS